MREMADVRGGGRRAVVGANRNRASVPSRPPEGTFIDQLHGSYALLRTIGKGTSFRLRVCVDGYWECLAGMRVWECGPHRDTCRGTETVLIDDYIYLIPCCIFPVGWASA